MSFLPQTLHMLAQLTSLVYVTVPQNNLPLLANVPSPASLSNTPYPLTKLLQASGPHLLAQP